MSRIGKLPIAIPAGVEVKLFVRYIRRGAEAETEPDPREHDDDAPLVAAY